MRTRLITACLIALLGVVGTGMAKEPEAPGITSWSNSKTGDEKTFFQVKPGEKITFSVKAEGAEIYQWLVDGAVQAALSASRPSPHL